MQIQSSFPSQTNQTKSRGWLQPLLLLGFIICLIIGLTALGALWWLYRAPAALRSTSPLPTFRTEQIIPQLALMQLAGDPSEALAYQALTAGEIETSRALTWISIDQMAAARVELILKLAQHVSAEDQSESAQNLYKQARALAVLDSALTPMTRSQALLRCVSGLLALGEQAAALDAAQQLLLIVQQAPDLLPAQRSQLLRDLQSMAPSAKPATFERELNELIRNPYLSPSTTLLSGQWPILTDVPALDPTIAALITERQQAARALAERLLQVSAIDAEGERQRLVRALLIEDQQRTAYFNQISTVQNLTFSIQFSALQQKRDWQLIKLAVAQRLYGLSLIPEWEASQVAILQEVNTTTADLQEALIALAKTQETPEQQLVQRFYALTWLAQQIEFGFYPQSYGPELSEQLRVLQGEFVQANIVPALPVAYKADATPPGFRIVTPISR